MKTKKVGIIGTNSAGKTTMCYDVLAKLKKAGAICDGVLQQDRRLTFQVKRDGINLLDVEPLAQYSLLLQQMKTEADIVLGEGVDIVVSDRSPFDLYAYYVNVLGGDRELGRFIYHCTIPCLMASAQAVISTAPAAPNMWPVAPLVELTATFRAYWPKTVLIAFVSQTSPCGVEVPWALM